MRKVKVKRKRGRPPGSKNKTKTNLTVTLHQGFTTFTFKNPKQQKDFIKFLQGQDFNNFAANG